MQLLANIDVPDLGRGEAFYTNAFGLKVSRRFGGVVELAGGSSLIHLLEKAEGSAGAGDAARTYDRHWTPGPLDFVVEDLDTTLAAAIAAGATVETGPLTRRWGRIAMLSDPFGNGFCIIEMLNRGYDELVEAAP